MIENYLLNGGIVTSGTFITYLIYQSSLDRKEREIERKTRIEEKNQFINMLLGIKEELAQIKFYHQNKK